MQDLRYAFRLLRRQPLFAVFAVLTLTLGIGAPTIMFSVVNSVLLRPLPYGNPSTLVWMYGAFRLSDTAAVSGADFVDYRRDNQAFTHLAAMAIAPTSVSVAGPGEPVRLQASRVSAGMITTLGVVPAVGQDFRLADESTASRAAIISDRLWREWFDHDPAVLGRSLTVDNQSRTIVGVMPPRFALPYDAFIRLADPVDVYLPIALDDSDAQVRRFHAYRLIGRLRPGVALRDAQAAMDVIARQLERAYPENETWRLRLVPLQERIVGNVRPALTQLMMTVVLLLLVACANVAGLLLARGVSRRSEIAVRSALGASRSRVIRQLLIEGFVLSTIGAATAMIAASWAIDLFRRVGPASFPRLSEIAIDDRVVAFALATTLLTTMMFALVPALHASRSDLMAFLTLGRQAGGDRRAGRGQRVLVAGQLAVTVVLLVVAALLIRSFARLAAVDVGFQSDGVAVARVTLPDDRYPTAATIDEYYSTFLDRLRATPGIDGAAFATAPPLSGANDTAVHRPGQPPQTPADRRFAQIRWIRGDYFSTLGIRLTSGRSFDDRLDRPGATDVAIISRRAATELFGSDAPVGERLVADLGSPTTVEIVGVVGDVRVFGQAEPAPPMIYLSARQRPNGFMQVVVKSSAGIGFVTNAVRRTALATDPTLPVARVQAMNALIDESVAQPRFSTMLVASLAGTALALALVGVYGTIAYAVSSRRQEIAVRLALGATRGNVLTMVMREGVAFAGPGVAIGLLGAALSSRLASGFLFEIGPADPVSYAGAATLIVVTTLAAMLIPAHRAARTEPMSSLRGD